jgi:hypothetical protein
VILAMRDLWALRDAAERLKATYASPCSPPPSFVNLHILSATRMEVPMRFGNAVTTGCTTVVLMVLGGSVLAQEPPRAAQIGTRDDSARDLRIEIEVPAQRLEAGRDLGFVALLTNASTSEVRFGGGDSLTLTIPLSLDPQGWQAGWHAFFPTQSNGKEFVLQPGDAYRVFWTINKDPAATPPSLFNRLITALTDLMNPRYCSSSLGITASRSTLNTARRRA